MTHDGDRLLEEGFVFTERQAKRAGLARGDLNARLKTGSLRKLLAPRLRELPLDAPVYDSARDGELQAGALETRLRQRFVGVLPLASVLYSTRDRVDPAKLEHEVHVTELFLRARSTDPTLSWISEHAIAAQFGARGDDTVIPDAALVDAEGRIQTFLDYVSAYRSPRLSSLVAFARSHSVPIQLW